MSSSEDEPTDANSSFHNGSTSGASSSSQSSTSSTDSSGSGASSSIGDTTVEDSSILVDESSILSSFEMSTFDSAGATSPVKKTVTFEDEVNPVPSPPGDEGVKQVVVVTIKGNGGLSEKDDKRYKRRRGKGSSKKVQLSSEMLAESAKTGVPPVPLDASPPGSPLDVFNTKFLKTMQEIVYRYEKTRVFIGGVFAAHNRELLAMNGITHVVTIGVGMDPPFATELSYLVVPVHDAPEVDLKSHFDVTYDFIDDAITSGGCVLVHCAAGVSRSATVCTAYLMRKYQLKRSEALSVLKSARECVNPNDGFLKQLRLFETEMGLSGGSDYYGKGSVYDHVDGYLPVSQSSFSRPQQQQHAYMQQPYWQMYVPWQYYRY